jgi:glycosyltransferase involved in cell wall biosynthesis
MLVGICDFPSAYSFPPHGYGGIERWLWAVAVGAKRAGADVHLLGPQWRDDLGADWTVRPVRLESTKDVGALQAASYDLLVVGHEYPSLPAWRVIFDELDADVATFQHWPYFNHQSGAFDGQRSRLYCYSAEMAGRYREHRPIRELAVHLGLDEDEPPATDSDGLIWLGRIDEEKAPHIAVMAAGILGRPITVVGPTFSKSYVDRYAALFDASNVTMAGELGGQAKAEALRGAKAFVYTAARDYIEAGAAVFGESLRAGTPVAALAWREGTCADAALCPDTGRIGLANPADDDHQAARVLAEAIEAATELKGASVQEIGLARFDPARHFAALAGRS